MNTGCPPADRSACAACADYDDCPHTDGTCGALAGALHAFLPSLILWIVALLAIWLMRGGWS